MSQDKVQLQREEIVGNEVVLQAINPKTKTNSITDDTKGTPLNETLARMWNSINNKLQRVVNSVNGRTGVVLLDANDVGLGNVDNVSFDDIKKWVINTIAETFETKRIIVKTYLSEIDAIIGGNDKAYENTAFFSEYGEEGKNDYLSYIGYIYWNDSESPAHLDKVTKAIRVIGYTDRSVIYNTDASTPTRTDRNFSGGGLGVNIWKGEDALKVYNNAISGPRGHAASALNDSGLYIDKDKVQPNVYYFDGVYGNMSPNDPNALLYYNPDPSADPSNYTKINIKIDGKSVNLYSKSSGKNMGQLYTHQHFKKGDIIFSNFNYENYIDPDSPNGFMYPGMCESLTCRQPSVGKVTQAPDFLNPNTSYVVEFFQLRPNVTGGLKLTDTNYDFGPVGNAISLDKLNGPVITKNDEPLYAPIYLSNMSGINTLNGMNMDYRSKKKGRVISTVLPTGESANILSDDNGDSNGAFIAPNFSLCIIPRYVFTHAADLPTGRPITNWPITGPSAPEHSTVDILDYNMIGVNLAKIMEKPSGSVESAPHSRARNISGLRINTDSQEFGKSWFGFGEGTDKLEYDLQSGGLSVNVGRFLCIGSPDELKSTEFPKSSEYYDEGKVNVRIDESTGLADVGDNTLGIKIYEHGLAANDNGNLGGGISYESHYMNPTRTETGLCVNRGLGLRMSFYRRQGEISGQNYPAKSEAPIHLAVSLSDPGYASDDMGIEPHLAHELYGGLRYIQGQAQHDFFNAIGIRINESDELYGDELKKGSEGLKITNKNVLGVQRGQGLDLDKDGGVTIKISDDFTYNTDDELVLSHPSANVDVFRIIDKDNNMIVYNPTGNLPAGFIDVTLGPGLKVDDGVSATEYHQQLLEDITEKIDPTKESSMKLAQIFAYYSQNPTTAEKVKPADVVRGDILPVISSYLEGLISGDDASVITAANLIGQVENNKVKYSDKLDPLFSKYNDGELIEYARNVYKGTHLQDGDRNDILRNYFELPEANIKDIPTDMLPKVLDTDAYHSGSTWHFTTWNDICGIINVYNADSVASLRSQLITDTRRIPYIYGMLKYSIGDMSGVDNNEITLKFVLDNLEQKIQSYSTMTVRQMQSSRETIATDCKSPSGAELALKDLFLHSVDIMKERVYSKNGTGGIGVFLFGDDIVDYEAKNVISIISLAKDFGMTIEPEDTVGKNTEQLMTELANYLFDNIPIVTIQSRLFEYDIPETSPFYKVNDLYQLIISRMNTFTVAAALRMMNYDPAVNTGKELFGAYNAKKGEFESKSGVETVRYFMRVKDYSEIVLYTGMTSADTRENVIWKDFKDTILQKFFAFYDNYATDVDVLKTKLQKLIDDYDLDIAEININSDTKHEITDAIMNMTIDNCLRFIADGNYALDKSGESESPDES